MRIKHPLRLEAHYPRPIRLHRIVLHIPVLSRLQIAYKAVPAVQHQRYAVRAVARCGYDFSVDADPCQELSALRTADNRRSCFIYRLEGKPVTGKDIQPSQKNGILSDCFQRVRSAPVFEHGDGSKTGFQQGFRFMFDGHRRVVVV